MLNLILILGIMITTLSAAFHGHLQPGEAAILMLIQVFALASGSRTLRSVVSLGMAAWLFYGEFVKGLASRSPAEAGQLFRSLGTLLVVLLGAYTMFRGPFASTGGKEK